MPYAVGFHPGFPWPLVGDDRSGHRFEFDAAERPSVPLATPGGLIRPSDRNLPFDDRILPLTPDLLAQNAIMLVDVNSRSLRYVAPDGSAIGFETDNFPHFGIWGSPEAPFVSIEALTSYGDRPDYDGEFADRPSTRLLPPGASAEHRVTLTWRPAAAASPNAI